jgi:glycosyltransferase involved in cell wall biosynthesis
MSYNILLIAHEFSPLQGSECAQGWNIATRLSKYHKIFVLYATGSQFSPNSYLKSINNISDNYPNIVFINVNQTNFGLLLSTVNKFLFGKISPIGNPIIYYFIYNLWQKKAYKKSKIIIKNNKIDLIHLITSISYREPGYFWKIDLPFIWGPTGGLTSLPDSFIKGLPFKKKLIEIIRKVYINYEFNKVRIKKAINKSELIYTFSDYDRQKFIQSGAKNVTNLLDSGTTYFNLPIINHNNKIVVLWAGQLVDRKSFNILIESVVKLPNIYLNKFEFRILGEGILKNFYIKEIDKMNLKNLFFFEGQKNRNDLFEIMKTSDLFVHTSYREATTNIIPEALSFNLPVVCHDISGMSIAINESCGHKIPLINSDISSNILSQFFIKIVDDKNYLLQLKNGAKKRSSEISWDNNALQISSDYDKILSLKI